MRKSISLALTALALCLSSLGARAELQLVELGPDRSVAVPAPRFDVLSQEAGRLELGFSLDQLALEKVQAGGELFDAVSIPGGVLRGEDGHPGLPVISKLIAMPRGSRAHVEVLARREETLPGLRLFPVQPDDAERFVMDESAYLAPTLDTVPTARIGEPGMMRGMQVASLQINPVRYDPLTREMRVTRSLDLEIRFDGGTVEAAGFIPESFDHLYRDMVLNYEDSGYYREGETQVGPGSYLIIYDDVPGVLTQLTPLIDWRKRQGYNVIAVSSSDTGGNNWQIEDYIDATYASADPPLEYVTLVGDAGGYIAIPCFYENLSGYNGEGDHAYSTIVGDDILADVNIGRLSVRSIDELSTVVDKIVTYETAPPTADSGWFTRAAVTGDPSSSGITTIYVNQWLKEQLLAYGYTQVDSIWSGNFVSRMTSSINQGLSVFGYRGYWYMSGMGSGNIMGLNNGYELPFAVIVTCDTGSFADDDNCRSEAFFRAPNGGGIASVGTATTGTHTRYNNCYYVGAWNGAINGEDHRVGPAHTRGKYELYNNYELSQPNKVEIWSTWNNLMGDPATQMWMGYPENLIVTHPATLPSGASSVPVSVSTAGGPLEGARVVIFKEGECSTTAYTNAAGEVNLPLSGVSDGTLQVTVLKHDHMPYLGSLALGSVPVFASLGNISIDDDNAGDSQGNGDGRANPGEAIELPLSLINLGSSDATNVSATLASDDAFITITDSHEDFGAIPAGGEVWCAEDFDVLVAADAPDGHVIDMDLVATDGFQTWTSLVQLEVSSAAFAYENFTWTGGDLDPGESGSFSVMMLNGGSQSGSGISAHLASTSPWIIIGDPEGSYADLPPGADGENAIDPFGISVLSDCIPGHQAHFTMTLTFNGGAEDVVDFSLPVGSAAAGDPTGPDAYGYYAYDDSDTAYAAAPVYDWVEIDPNYGGPGSDLGLNDFAYEQDDTKTIAIPFDFSYYGVTYGKLSICSNGWAAMGETSLVPYRNWNIPCAGSPAAMIAVFWDDLYQEGGNRVYTWDDTTGHRFVIQWSRLKNRATHSIQNFELILLDPVFHPSSTGDGMILMQYDTVNNTDSTNGYATVGIENQDRSDGLLYSYWNQYPVSAANLQGGRAILFTPLGSVPLPTCDVTPDHFAEIVPPGEISLDMLHVSNNGEEGSMLSYTIEVLDPNLPRSVAGSWLALDPSSYTAETTEDFTVTVHNASDDVEWIAEVTLDFPPGATINSGTNLVGGSGGDLTFSGTGDGALVTWSDEDGGWGNIYDGETATATLNVTFSGLAGDLSLPWGIQGDIYGSDPHYIDGTFDLTEDGPSVVVISPNGGELWTVGDQRTIQYLASGGGPTVDVYLRRGSMGNWSLIASGLPAGNQSFDWTVDGPGNQNCKIKVVDTSDSSIFDESDGYFTIQNSLDWLQLDSMSGNLAVGETDDIHVTFDATDLVEGSYEAEIRVVNNAGASVSVPVMLIVNESGTGVENVPARVFLARNHPNPFNPKTSIRFGLPEAGSVRLAVYDMSGRLVRVLVSGELSTGTHELIWDGRDDAGEQVSSGIYFARLRAGDIRLNRKMVLLK